MRKSIIFYDVIYNLLLRTVKWRDKNQLCNKMWFSCWNYSIKKYKGPISTQIHGFKVKVNNGFSYPFYARLFSNYNNPLVQLVYSVYELYGRRITMIDVGSAIGDTSLLLVKNLPDVIEKLYCIEGDIEFYEYLKANKKHFPENELYNVLLGESDNGKVKNLVKTHLGTASSIGDREEGTVTLDTLLFDKLTSGVDILKIDVDGFDGKVLKGGQELISKYRPLIIFEWHPIMIKRTNNDFYEAFDVLRSLGYTKYLWYNKYGFFSHFDFNDENQNRAKLVELCLNDIHDFDWHYDIIAIHNDSNIDELKLAELKKAKEKTSSY